MSERLEYRAVVFDRKNRAQDETETEGVLKILNANGSQGWDLVKFDSSSNGETLVLWMKRRIPG